MTKTLGLLAFASIVGFTLAQDFTNTGIFHALNGRPAIIGLKRYPLLPSINTDFYKGILDECRKAPSPQKMIRIPNTCSFFVQCSFYQWNVAAGECAPGTAFDDSQGICYHAVTAKCGANGNPCLNGNSKNVTNGKYCHKYLFCNSANELETGECALGFRFDIARGECVVMNSNTECVRPSGIDTVLSTVCVGAYSEDNEFRGFTQTQKIRKSTGETVTYVGTYRCPQSTVYKEGCGCQNEGVTLCKPSTVVDLSAVNNRWNTALKFVEGSTLSQINGTATIETQGGQFNGWAFFSGFTSFNVYAMENYGPGNYWTLSFKLQAMTSRNPFNPGLNAGSGKIALVDNSGCGVGPTFGCEIQAPNNVRCYVTVRDVVTSNTRVLEASVDVTSFREVVSVKLSRQNTAGRMEVTAGGNTKFGQWTYGFNDVIDPVQCDGQIGAGTGRNNFMGYIDQVLLLNECPPTK